MTTLNADAGTDAIASQLKDAAGDLEAIHSGNRAELEHFEQEGWNHLLEPLELAQQKIDHLVENLVDVAEKVGVGGQMVREVLLANTMITHASKRSLGRA